MHNPPVLAFPKLLTLILLGTGIPLSGSPNSGESTEIPVLPATDAGVLYTGRTCLEDDGVVLTFPGTEIRVRFRGKSVQLNGQTLSRENWFNLRIDGVPKPRVDVPSGEFSLTLVNNLDPDAIHELRLLRRNEAWQGTIRLDSFSLPEGGQFEDGLEPRSRQILCIGDSITCGEKTEFIPPYAPDGNCNANAELSYGWQLGQLLGADVHLVSYGGKGVVRDWQGKTDEVTAISFFERSHANRPSPQWDHSRYQPQLVIICLGTNDYATGIVDHDPYVAAYRRLIERVHAVHPGARILLMSSPMLPGYAPEKSQHLIGILHEVAASFENEGAPFVKVLEIGDYSGSIWNSHPTGSQHRRMAEKLLPVVSGWLGWEPVD